MSRDSGCRCRQPIVPLLLTCLALAACQFPGALSPEDRVALDSCQDEANRVYNAQNRYQLSERDSRDTPFSAGTQAPPPSAGLADQYSHERMVSDCLRHSNASPDDVPHGP